MFKQFGLKQKPMFMIIPMIDIIFFLLVFFMMNSLQTVAQKSLDVQLPVAQAAVQQKHVPVIITLDTAGHIVIDGKPLSLTDAKEVLVTKQEANPAVGRSASGRCSFGSRSSGSYYGPGAQCGD